MTPDSELTRLSKREWELDGIDGTGENGDNREIAFLVALFSPSTLFPPFAQELPCILCLPINFNELKLTDGVSRLILPGANFE
jgi:hypothetical protein